MKEQEIAIALKYNPELPAPFITVKGKNNVAKRIKAIAEEYDIDIISCPDITKNLFYIDTGSYIPEELYQIVAEILLFIEKVPGEKTADYV